MSKKRNKTYRALSKFSLLSTLKLLTDTFAVKQLHTSCYTYNIILKLLIFGYNIMALLLCERQQNWLRVVTVVF